MSDQQKRPTSVAEMNGRIDEIEAQRNQAQARAAILSGERLLAKELLDLANAEIERLCRELAAAETKVEELQADLAVSQSLSVDRSLVPAQDVGRTINH